MFKHLELDEYRELVFSKYSEMIDNTYSIYKLEDMKEKLINNKHELSIILNEKINAQIDMINKKIEGIRERQRKRQAEEIKRKQEEEELRIIERGNLPTLVEIKNKDNVTPTFTLDDYMCEKLREDEEYMKRTGVRIIREYGQIDSIERILRNMELEEKAKRISDEHLKELYTINKKNSIYYLIR